MEVRFSDTGVPGVPWLDVKDAENPASHAYSVLPAYQSQEAFAAGCLRKSTKSDRHFMWKVVDKLPQVFRGSGCLPDSVYLSLCLLHRQCVRGYRTPLAHALLQLQKRLAEVRPHPKSSAAGPGRSISMNQLLEFFDHFQGYICERNMYYVCHNMLLPMTRLKKLSYAELAGPSTLQWFVSHYWGTPEPSQACWNFWHGFRWMAGAEGPGGVRNSAGFSGQTTVTCQVSNKPWTRSEYEK